MKRSDEEAFHTLRTLGPLLDDIEIKNKKFIVRFNDDAEFIFSVKNGQGEVELREKDKTTTVIKLKKGVRLTSRWSMWIPTKKNPKTCPHNSKGSYVLNSVRYIKCLHCGTQLKP